MRKTIIMLLLAISTSFGLWAKGNVQTVEIKTRINCDHCKICGSCSARLEKALYDKKGIVRVDVDDKNMIIKVVYNKTKIAVEDIKKTIAASGYDADDVKAPAEAVAKLDGCCKGEEG